MNRQLRLRSLAGAVVALVLGLALALLPPLAAESRAPTERALPTTTEGMGKRHVSEPGTCLLGVYVQDLRDFQFAANSLFASMRLWSVCPNAGRSPLDDLTILNANGIAMGEIHGQRLANNSDYFRNDSQVTWSTRTVEGSFYHHWSAKNFPFDRHRLSFQFEVLKEDSASFFLTPDYQHSGYDPAISRGEWVARDFSINEVSQRYGTNFGRPDKRSSEDGVYSRISVEITLQRARVTSFFKLCTGVYAAVVIAGVAFILDMREPDIVSGRTGLLVGCLFAAIVNMQQAEATLGMSEDVTLTDSIHILSIIYILAASLLAINTYLRCEAGEEDRARHVDRRICLPIYMTSFAVFNLVIIAYAATIG
ncbi:MAG: hypothetical protein ACKOPT_11405 [Cyanobium sp.]